MADTPDIKRLEMRISELENQLKQYQSGSGSGQAMPEISSEEMRAFMKVGSALGAFDDWGCGVNECRPVSICRICRVCQICRICRICRPCINECVCGPCNVGGGMSAGGFQGFGD
jgi:hypothetical protein